MYDDIIVHIDVRATVKSNNNHKKCVSSGY